MPKQTNLTKVEFVKDFDGHKAGEVLKVSPSNLMYFSEWEAVKVLEEAQDK